MEALRALTRQPSAVVYRRLLADQRRRQAAQGGQAGQDRSPRDRLPPLHRLLRQVTPRTAEHPTPGTNLGAFQPEAISAASIPTQKNTP